MSRIVVYTDGSTKENPGLGAYGFVAVDKDEVIYRSGEFVNMMTNNQAELLATISAIEWFIKKYDSSTLLVIKTDSKYCYSGFNVWMEKWIKKDWKRADGKDVANIELWKKLLVYKEKYSNIKFEWIKGHSGNKFNDMVDEMCKKIWKKKEKKYEQ